MHKCISYVHNAYTIMHKCISYVHNAYTNAYTYVLIYAHTYMQIHICTFICIHITSIYTRFVFTKRKGNLSKIIFSKI